MAKRLPTNPAIPVAPDPESTPPVGSDIGEIIEFRVRRLEADLPKLSAKVDAQGDRMEQKFDEQNEILRDLSRECAGTTAAVEQLAITTSQAMSLVTASAKGAIQVNTTRETMFITDAGDAAKTRRAFSLKVLAILGGIATAITTALAAGRC